MSVNLASLYAQQYATNIKLLLQQKGSRLRGKVMEGSAVGEQMSPVDQVGAIEMQPVTTRFAPMGRVDATVDRRWVLPSSFDLPQLIDTFDKLKMIVDPKSSYVENAVAAAGRQYDNALITAMNGTNQTGKTGSTGTVFLAGNQIAVNFGSATNTGLTVAKLREARRLFMSHNLDMDSEQLWLCVNAKAHDSLLAEVQVISSDFNGNAPVLQEGKITRFLGFNFVHTELLTNNVTPYRQILVWAKSGVHLGIWDDIKTDVRQRADLAGLPWQCYVYMTCGASRLEEKKVVRILANEA
jgi:hypothetical protein